MSFNLGLVKIEAHAAYGLGAYVERGELHLVLLFVHLRFIFGLF